MDVSVTSREQGPWTIIEVAGEIDVYTAHGLREKLSELIDSEHRELVVDLRGVGFMDSTGLGVLVGALKRVRTNEGDLALVCTGPRILKVFEITGLTKVFAIHRSVDEATVSS